jgi:hypothetical protein
MQQTPEIITGGEVTLAGGAYRKRTSSSRARSGARKLYRKKRTSKACPKGSIKETRKGHSNKCRRKSAIRRRSSMRRSAMKRAGLRKLFKGGEEAPLSLAPLVGGFELPEAPAAPVDVLGGKKRSRRSKSRSARKSHKKSHSRR